jgi:hypothetical protein
MPPSRDRPSEGEGAERTPSAGGPRGGWRRGRVERPDDPLGAARGTAIGCTIGAAVWVGIIALAIT